MVNADLQFSKTGVVNIRPLDCTIDHPDICDRAARLLGVVYGSQAAQLQQRAATNELLVQLASAGIQIDPRQIRNLTFATDTVDTSGSNINVTNTPSVTLNDIFATLMYLIETIATPVTVDTSARVRQSLENIATGVTLPTVTTVTTVTTVATVTNLTQLGSIDATIHLRELMDINWASTIRSNIT